MKKWTLLSIFLLCFLSMLQSQVVQTIIPKEPVVVGTAFQVQYIILNPSNIINTVSPSFDSFRLVSGPHIYTGKVNYNGSEQEIENLTFTLIPAKTGILRMPGLTVSYKNLTESKSQDQYIEVISPPRASFNTRSSYTDVSLYAPSSTADPDKLVKNNLFIKTEVSKRACYEGEPIMVTYKLYSRLQSSSEATKAPGLYGFSMIDMVDINESHQWVETVNGKVYNTYLLRQMQLFPMQPGNLLIDQMHVQNDIEFDDAVNNKQKLRFQKELLSDSIWVKVKPLPGKKPESFTGAVGQFSIKAYLKDTVFPVNEQGQLIVSISGKGNFIQFGPPDLKHIQPLDFFDPLIMDSLNKQTVPEEGKRTYVFNFTADSTGSYVIPPISFSYFDVNASSYKTIATDTLFLKVSGKVSYSVQFIRKVKGKTIKYTGLILTFVLSAIALFFVFKFNSRRPLVRLKEQGSDINYPRLILQLDKEDPDEKEFMIRLNKIISAFLSEKGDQLAPDKRTALKVIQEECQLIIYSDISDPEKKEELRKKAYELIQKT